MADTLIKQKDYLTTYADLKELGFVNAFKGKTHRYAKKWRSAIMARTPIVAELHKDVGFTGNILEIGAGSCWFSAELSKIPQVQSIYALDFSERVLKEVAPSVMQTLNAQKHKITLTLGDYHRLPFGNDLFDFVVIDAALHHTDYLDILLTEVGRVLKDEGRVVAIREPIKSFFWPLKKKLGLVDRHVKTFGMLENTYDRTSWTKYFAEAGFDLRIKPIFYRGDWKETLVRTALFRPLNGILYSRYYFVASKNMRK